MNYVYRIPISSGMAVLDLPDDLSVAEARRIASFIEAVQMGGVQNPRREPPANKEQER